MAAACVPAVRDGCAQAEGLREGWLRVQGKHFLTP